jgi:ParB family protein of integrating conjugative element (PFGI_1 class)
MGRKPSNVGELARALKAPNFANRDANAIVGGVDPVSPTTLVLRVTDIKAYEHNPRTAENHEYPRLKDSIRARRGLTTPLTVTKRPGESQYVIAAGGNSRLKALKELAEETGDEAFGVVTCRFEPWESESRVFVNHLIENDVRGTMTFGDKARAVVEWRRLYAESHPGEQVLTQRDLADRLAAAGYRVHQTMLKRFFVAAEFLIPHLPRLFESGFGRPAAERLARLRECAAGYWDDAAKGSETKTRVGAFEELFAAACAEHDCHCADWDHDLFQSALTLQIASALRLDHKLVALDIDSLCHGCGAETAEMSEAAKASAAPDVKATLKGDATSVPTSQWAFERSREAHALRLQRSRSRAAPVDGGASRGSHEPEPSMPPAASASVVAADDDRFDPAQFRQAIYMAARDLAAHYQLGELLRSVEIGFGFFIEAPEASAVPEESKHRATGPGEGLALEGVRSSAWWFLCLAADQLAPAHLARLGEAHPASWIVELFARLPQTTKAQNPTAMLQLLVGEPSAECLVHELLTNPSAEAADALDRVLRGCRALRGAAATGSFDLWEAPR